MKSSLPLPVYLNVCIDFGLYACGQPIILHTLQPIISSKQWLCGAHSSRLPESWVMDTPARQQNV